VNHPTSKKVLRRAGHRHPSDATSPTKILIVVVAIKAQSKATSKEMHGRGRTGVGVRPSKGAVDYSLIGTKT